MLSDAYLAYRALIILRVGMGVGVVGVLSHKLRQRHIDTDKNLERALALGHFRTSSLWPIPGGYPGPAWKIRNDYPQRGGSSKDMPWSMVDFKVNPLAFCEVVKQYCWVGNVENCFVAQKNRVRDWYHAPWLHATNQGREPLSGLTFERSTPPFDLSKTQHRYLQIWACGYYNTAGASLFSEVWADPTNPRWEEDLTFAEGSVVFKLLFTDATDKELPTLVGSPNMPAVIAASDNPGRAPDPAKRNSYASRVRLLQMDFAVRDPRSPIGWVFGAFLYDGSRNNENPWDRLTPVGIQWGNDPQVTQEAIENGEKLQECWINPRAESLRAKLGGTRPSWGWNGRLNGPADNFISSCASCHSLAQREHTSKVTPPTPRLLARGWVPDDDKLTMHWFRNIPPGRPFDPGAKSGDYSLQLMIGYRNWLAWSRSQRSVIPIVTDW